MEDHERRLGDLLRELSECATSLDKTGRELTAAMTEIHQGRSARQLLRMECIRLQHANEMLGRGSHSPVDEERVRSLEEKNKQLSAKLAAAERANKKQKEKLDTALERLAVLEGKNDCLNSLVGVRREQEQRINNDEEEAREARDDQLCPTKFNTIHTIRTIHTH